MNTPQNTPSVDGDECGAGARGMQAPSLPFNMPRLVGGVIHFESLLNPKRSREYRTNLIPPVAGHGSRTHSGQ